jgi:hypothetical protein
MEAARCGQRGKKLKKAVLRAPRLGRGAVLHPVAAEFV